MKNRIRGLVVSVGVALVAIGAMAGPTPRETVQVIGATTVATHSAGSGASLILQCPGGIVQYRTLNAAELADSGGLITTGAGMTDGGAFGVLADFSGNNDPIGIFMAVNQVAVGLLGTDAGLLGDGGPQSLPCYFFAQ